MAPTLEPRYCMARTVEHSDVIESEAAIPRKGSTGRFRLDACCGAMRCDARLVTQRDGSKGTHQSDWQPQTGTRRSRHREAHARTRARARAAAAQRIQQWHTRLSTGPDGRSLAARTRVKSLRCRHVRAIRADQQYITPEYLRTRTSGGCWRTAKGRAHLNRVQANKYILPREVPVLVLVA